MRLVRSLRTIRGRFRRSSVGVVPPLERSGRPASTLHSHELFSADQLHKKLSRHDGEQRNIIKNHISIKPGKFLFDHMAIEEA